MSGLAMIYRKHLTDGDVPQATKKAVTWIKDKILHGYYMTGMEDRSVLVIICLESNFITYCNVCSLSTASNSMVMIFINSILLNLGEYNSEVRLS